MKISRFKYNLVPYAAIKEYWTNRDLRTFIYFSMKCNLDYSLSFLSFLNIWKSNWRQDIVVYWLICPCLCAWVSVGMTVRPSVCPRVLDKFQIFNFHRFLKKYIPGALPQFSIISIHIKWLSMILTADYTSLLINMSCLCVRLRTRRSKNIGQMANFELS